MDTGPTRRPKFRRYLCLVLLGAVLYPVASWLWCEMGRSIGTFETRDAAERASIQALSDFIRSCPDADEFRVYWRISTRDELGGGGSTYYIRRSKLIGHENDPWSGYVTMWENVDDDAIHAVAAQNGNFDSFGERAWPPKQQAP